MDVVIGVLVPLGVVVLGWLLKRLDRHNAEQHAVAQEERRAAQSEILGRFDRLEDKVDSHIAWHVDHPIAPIDQEVTVK